MKLLMVGFDGLDPSLISGFPTFNQFQDNCYLLRSVPSTMTQEAWGSMFTGRPPSEINVIALPRDPNRVSTLKGIGAQTIFESLGEAGYRIGSIGMPMTFPVMAIDAFMVAGFPLPAPQYRANTEYFYPPSIKEIIDSTYCAYLWANEKDPPSKDDVTYKAIENSIMKEKKKLKCVIQILDNLGSSDLDFLAIGFSFTDIAAHCRRIYPIDKVYKAADEILQQILDTFKTENMMVVSDHGLAMVPWRGKPFKGHIGVPHRLYGTCIGYGNDIEKALKQIKMNNKPSSRILQLIRNLKRTIQFKEYGGLFKNHDTIDITDIYALIAHIFSIPTTSRLVKQESMYSEEEFESIKKRLELLGYM